MNTGFVLAVSFIVATVVGLVGYSALSVLYHNPPMEAPVDITSSVLSLDCSKTTVPIGNLRYETLTSAFTVLGIGAKNSIEKTIIIDAVVPKASNLAVTRFPDPIIIPPRSLAYKEVVTPWANQSSIVRLVKPGDIYRVDGNYLTVLQTGPYNEYIGNMPIVEPPSNYNPPFNGNTRHALSISGTLMSSYISQPGYAATQLLSNVPRDNFLILTHVKLDRWVEDTDVPFFIDFYPGAQAIAYRASKTISFAVGGSPIQHTDEAYMGVLAQTNQMALFLQDDTTPRTTAPPATTTNINLVVGVAREKEVSSFIGFFSYDYSRSGHLDIFNYLNGYYEIWRYGSRIRSGYAPVYSNINYLKVNQGQYSAPFIIVYNPTRGSSDWVFNYETCWVNWRQGGIWVCGVQSILLQRLNEPKQIETDFLVFWEDLIGFGTTGDNWNDLVVRITVFTDKTARIAVFMGYAGYAVDFYITIKNVNPIEGDYVFTKQFNTVIDNVVGGYYREVPNMIYYPSARIVPGYVSSQVYYIGMFKSPVLTVYGLFPGDIVILSTPNRAVSYEVSGSSLSVNLLTAFGARELIEAMKNGGVTMIIRPSAERIMSLLPKEALIHVKSDWVDTWVPTNLLVSPKCSLSASGGYGSVVLERRGEYIRVTLTDSRTGSTIRFGTYARVEAVFNGFTMTITYQNGATETISPGMVKDQVTIGATIRILAVDNSLTIITETGVVNVPGYSSVSVSLSQYGSFSLRGYFGK